MALLGTQVDGTLQENTVTQILSEDIPQRDLKRLLRDFDYGGNLECSQLPDLRSAIDGECARVTNLQSTNFFHDQDSWNQDGETATPESVLNLVLYLSKPHLFRLAYPGAARCREYQLRTLISAIALLQHLKVSGLSPTDFDILHEDLANRYYDLVSGPSRRNPMTEATDNVRQTSALYLVRLAQQYASLFERRERLVLAHVNPLVRLVSAVTSVVGLSSLRANIGTTKMSPRPAIVALKARAHRRVYRL